MLILNRRLNDSVIIETPEGDIEVKITRNRRGIVSVGLDAPKQYNIYRSEVKRKEAMEALNDGNRKDHELCMRPLREEKP